MGRQIDLLSSLPQTKRDASARAADKSSDVIAVARRYGERYFDGDRKYGYGGYKYDGRWKPVAGDILEHYFPHVDKYDEGRKPMRILDVGCAKGFLVSDLVYHGADAYGLDLSKYALENCHPDVVGRLHWGWANILHMFPDDSFDLVLSINTLHNLDRNACKQALREIMRVSKGKAFVQVDSYNTPEEKALFEDWVLTAEFHDYPDGWLALFEEAGYTGDYDWTTV